MKHLFRSIVCILLTLILLAGFPMTVFAEGNANGYSDVPASAWYYDAVMTMTEKGIVSGVGDGKFAPHATMTRAMVVTMIYRLAGSPDTSSMANPFHDVPESSWYANAVKWADASGITKGVNETSFAPMKNIKREELACFIFRYGRLINARITAPEGYCPFGVDLALVDENDCSPYAQEAVITMIRRAMMIGDGDCFHPFDPCTRAEAVMVLYRFDKYLGKYGTYNPEA